MEFSETAWTGFRNLEPCRQQWRPGLNVFFGPNGAGKTNLLESFNVLSGWGGFSPYSSSAAAGRASSMVSWTAAGAAGGKALLAGQASGERDLEVNVQIGARMSLRAAGEKTTYSELRQLLPSLSFLARDIGLVDGSPSARRLFLDKLCVLCSPLYARRLHEYRQLVQQRGALLRSRQGSPFGASALSATAAPIAQFGGWIREVRKRAVERLKAALLEKSLSSILPFELEIGIELHGSAGLEDQARDMAASLEASREREFHAGSVLVGPHRDDLLFSCFDRPAALTLSRGQKRRVVAAMMLAAGRLIETRLRLKPVLLLDDVTAELDEQGKKLTGRALVETGWQVFVTGAENPFEDLPCAAWQVIEGKILG